MDSERRGFFKRLLGLGALVVGSKAAPCSSGPMPEIKPVSGVVYWDCYSPTQMPGTYSTANSINFTITTTGGTL